MTNTAFDHSFSPEIAEALAKAADELFTTERIVDASGILNAVLSNENWLGLISTLSEVGERLLERYALVHPELELGELSAKIVTRMWDRPEDELLGGAYLAAWANKGVLNSLSATTRGLIEGADPSTGLMVKALLVTGLSMIVSHEARDTRYGDAIRKTFS